MRFDISAISASLECSTIQTARKLSNICVKYWFLFEMSFFCEIDDDRKNNAAAHCVCNVHHFNRHYLIFILIWLSNIIIVSTKLDSKFEVEWDWNGCGCFGWLSVNYGQQKIIASVQLTEFRSCGKMQRRSTFFNMISDNCNELNWK